ncbi:lysozyme inhibitor LprI family protein [Allosphingosinicella deserti]|uniref:Lysozyme inhibitor LprI N-terminal domain-containing protein n=1 Tax=Allosphingosinicella deserti TaxID=2116704 RepID=A0A2P7QN34_9SPHN|nr:hypothetical protein [Sphingomonas deserti]PSJ39371.1 hypothetical protein C7I55_12150 [Sphingomonas deserti]
MHKLLSTALVCSFIVTSGCDWMKAKSAPGAKTEKELAAEAGERLRKACSSAETYDRLKSVVFDEAARIRNSDARNLDPIAAASVVRMEKPVVKSRDEALDVTVCSGRFILELPPGAENAFDGMRRVSAEVEYSAQPAADGSGLVYQMDGAEPIVYRLATFGLAGGKLPQVVTVPQPSAPAAAAPQVDVVDANPAAQAAPAPVPKAPPVQPGGKPSFNCRYAGTRSERMICGSPALAARDRQMASVYYEAMANSDAATQRHLRRSRDAFLARREQCGSAACVDGVYAARISEIKTVQEGR